MKDFEKKFKQAVNNQKESIDYPDFQKVVSNLSGIKQHNTKYFKVRAGAIIMAGILLLLTLIGATFKDYIFGDYRSYLLQNAEDEGLVNVYQTQAENKEVIVTLEAIFSDQIYTYVKIAADGDSLNNIDGRNTDANLYKGSWLAERIKQARLTTAVGETLTFRNQIVWSDSSGTATTTPMIRSDNLEKNETILMFYGGPEKDTNIHFEVEFYDINTKVEFNDIKVKVPDVVTRDVSTLNLFIHVPYAKGQITQITYTPLQTQFKIIWHIDDVNALRESYDFVTDYSMNFVSGDKEDRNMIFPRGNLENSDGKESVYNDIEKFNPNDELKIDLYKHNFGQQNNREFIKTLLVIPPIQK